MMFGRISILHDILHPDFEDNTMRSIERGVKKVIFNFCFDFSFNQKKQRK